MIDFLSAAAEVQYVHYNTKFPSYTTAVTSGEYDAVAIVSVFLNAGGNSAKNLTSLVKAFNTTAGPMNTIIPYVSRLFSLSLSLSLSRSRSVVLSPEEISYSI
jgi:hypothetical protein